MTRKEKWIAEEKKYNELLKSLYTDPNFGFNCLNLDDLDRIPEIFQKPITYGLFTDEEEYLLADEFYLEDFRPLFFAIENISGLEFIKVVRRYIFNLNFDFYQYDADIRKKHYNLHFKVIEFCEGLLDEKINFKAKPDLNSRDLTFEMLFTDKYKAREITQKLIQKGYLGINKNTNTLNWIKTNSGYKTNIAQLALSLIERGFIRTNCSSNQMLSNAFYVSFNVKVGYKTFERVKSSVTLKYSPFNFLFL